MSQLSHLSLDIFVLAESSVCCVQPVLSVCGVHVDLMFSRGFRLVLRPVRGFLL